MSGVAPVTQSPACLDGSIQPPDRRTDHTAKEANIG